MIKVYFKKNNYAELVATFQSEDIYMACIPLIEEKCIKLGLEIIVKSFETSDAKFWVLAYGIGDDGYNGGEIKAFTNENDANKYAERNNLDDENGLDYKVISDVEVMKDYCNSFDEDYEKYLKYINTEKQISKQITFKINKYGKVYVK